jgi:hypothetical protein
VTSSSAQPRARWLSLAAAILLLDVSLTFQNIWPTPAVRWHGELSIELAVCVLGLLLAPRVLGRPRTGLLATIAAVWTALVVGHYAEVTAPALYGREVNLYWDLRHVSAVAEMLATAAARWLVIAVVGASAGVLFLLFRVLRWAWGRLGEAVFDRRERRALFVVAGAAVALFVAHSLGGWFAEIPLFPAPVTGTYARQVRLVLNARAARHGGHVLPASPSMHADLSGIRGADVLLFFIESYGAVAFERPEFAAQLAADRSALTAAIRDTHRDVVSAYVESPTFGGSSWLAHITLLSGVEVRDPDTNALLMTQKRDTLVTAFARQGYRTIGIMPGMWQSWPEGAFYGFDDIYGGARLDYRGPAFGWWDIPDQFSLAQVDALELDRRPRAPAFVFFPTVSTHIPFSPTPPYQPNWARLLTDTPYDQPEADRALNREPDWMDLGPDYVRAVSYAYQSLAGYLRRHPDGDFVMVLLGDHQPAAAVTGEGATWNVPVHVIASRRAIIDRLLAHGFREGLAPAAPAIGHMPALVPILFDAFASHPSSAGATP